MYDLFRLTERGKHTASKRTAPCKRNHPLPIPSRVSNDASNGGSKQVGWYLKQQDESEIRRKRLGTEYRSDSARDANLKTGGKLPEKGSQREASPRIIASRLTSARIQA